MTDRVNPSTERPPRDRPQVTPQDTPQGAPQDTPQGAPQDTPQGAPQDTPQGAPQDTPQVTVAITNYNGRELLEVLMPSLQRQTLRPSATVVVDDCSSDDSLEYLRQHWPDVRVRQLPRRSNVTVAMNECLRAGQTEFVVLLNNDIELDPDCLAELVAALRAHPQAAASAAKLRDYHDRRLLDGAGDVLLWRGAAIRRGQGKLDDGRYDEPSAIFAACGAVVAYRTSLLEEIGDFDEQYVAGLEDVDWSFRAQLLGYDVRYVPSAVAYHMGSATIGRTMTPAMAYLNWRNWPWLIAKDYPAGALVRHAPELLLQQVLVLGIALRDRRLGVWLRAWRDALRGLPEVLRKRRAIQGARRRGARELERVGRGS
jgi:GT2 family glycosyltransferase